MAQPVQRLADVVTLPARAAGAAAIGTARTVRDWQVRSVDDWGRDPDFVARVFAASRVRWDVAVGGTDLLPARAGALIVVNARRFALAPVFAALALGDACGRPVRFVGRPDIAPFGPMLQRLGGLLPIAAELEGALKAGELVVLGATHQATNATSGSFDPELIGAAIAARVRVHPAATLSVPGQLSARVEVAKPVRPARIRRGPLAAVELAAAVERSVDDLLVEFGGALTGTPLDWIPFDRWPLERPMRWVLG